jgi:dihydroorotate dehydrogenase electron transfer subunit
MHLDVIGPVGNGFDITKVKSAIIVAGGIGYAPLLLLAERLRYLNSEIYLYFGALSEELLRPIVMRSDSSVDLTFADGTPELLRVIQEEFTDIGAKLVRVSTDDGSLGQEGFVTDLLVNDINRNMYRIEDSIIYGCGPASMLQKVSEIAGEHGFQCQLLLEERMACGIGACYSCTCRIKGPDNTVHKKRVCVDGPVFKAKEIVWQS